MQRSRDEGVTVTFRTRPALFNGRVTVEGVPDPPNAAQLVNATKLDFGERFEEDQIAPAVESIMGLLTANGYFEAKVEPEVERRPGHSGGADPVSGHSRKAGKVYQAGV